jgi:Putative transposase
MARLAALVPPPRHPLVRYYGAWAQIENDGVDVERHDGLL